MDAYLEHFISAYIECALWSSIYTVDAEDAAVLPDCEMGDTINLDDYFDADDLAPEALEQLTEECGDFVQSNWDDLASLTAEQSGHDFWLTRNGHGAGFWDRGMGELGDRLSEASKPYGECDLYPAADGKVYAS